MSKLLHIVDIKMKVNDEWIAGYAVRDSYLTVIAIYWRRKNKEGVLEWYHDDPEYVTYRVL